MSHPLRDYYDATAEAWVKKRPRRAIRRQLAAILDQVPARREAAVDVGCGGGVYTAGLVPLFRRVIGIDLSYAMVALAHREVSSAVLCQADATRLPLQGQSVDFLVSCGLSEHLEDLGPFMAEIARVLRRDGRAVVRFVHRWSVWRPVIGRRYPGGFSVFSVRAVKVAAANQGLDLRSVRHLHAAGPFTSFLPAVVDFGERVPGLSQAYLATFEPVRRL